MEQEQVYYEDSREQVVVTETCFQVGNTTYEVRELDSPNIVKVTRSRKPPIVVALVGLSISAIAVYLSNGALQTVGSLTFGVGGLWWASRLPAYLVRIRLAEGELEALRTFRKSCANDVLVALNEAIKNRKNEC